MFAHCGRIPISCEDSEQLRLACDARMRDADHGMNAKPLGSSPKKLSVSMPKASVQRAKVLSSVPRTPPAYSGPRVGLPRAKVMPGKLKHDPYSEPQAGMFVSPCATFEAELGEFDMRDVGEYVDGVSYQADVAEATTDQTTVDVDSRTATPPESQEFVEEPPEIEGHEAEWEWRGSDSFMEGEWKGRGEASSSSSWRGSCRESRASWRDSKELPIGAKPKRARGAKSRAGKRIQEHRAN